MSTDRWCADELERLRGLVGGKLDSSTAGSGGERDAWREVPLRTRQRLQGGGMVGRGGWAPDQACEVWNDAHGSDLDTCSFVARWVADVVAVLDRRAEIRSGAGSVRDGFDDPELPEWCVSWLGSLLCDEKREYASALAWAMFAGLDAPESPGTAWAAKVERKLVNRYAAMDRRGEVTV